VLPDPETYPLQYRSISDMPGSGQSAVRTRLCRRSGMALRSIDFSALLKRRGRVKVPWRTVSSASLPDTAISVYIKVAALAQRDEGCTAGVTRLATYLRLSESTTERALRALSVPDPSDGVVELSRRRRTKRGGEGTTAERRVRPLRPGERFVWVPVALVEVLEPRQVRAWCALAYASAIGWAVTEAELGQVLVHHSGKRAGQPIGAAAASAVVDGLEALGFLIVRRRAGFQGRNVYEPVELPDRPQDLLQGNAARGLEPQSSSLSDGSGSQVSDGSLASKEDSRTDRQDERAGGVFEPAVGEVQGDWRKAAAENPITALGKVGGTDNLALRADQQAVARSAGRSSSSAGNSGYGGPELTYSRRMAWITEPVRWVLERSRVFIQRQFAREVAAQLALGIEPDRLRERLQRRFASVSPAEIRSPEGWLLKVAVVRWGCHNPKCESGVLWASSEPCVECQAERERRRQAHAREAATVPGPCPACGEHGEVCPMCLLQAAPPTPAQPGLATSRRPHKPQPPTTEGAKGESAVRVPIQCPECGSWASGRKADGRCGPCGLQHAVDQVVMAAMDAAGARLTGRAKIAAAGEAAADVRAGVERARAETAEQDLDADEVCCAVLGAAQARAEVWMRAAGEKQ
jgi:hypothetical protein